VILNKVKITVPSNSFNGTVNKAISLGSTQVVRVEPIAFLRGATGSFFIRFLGRRKGNRRE